MGRAQIRLLGLAEEDLVDIVTYIATERPAAAQKLAYRIEKDLRLLADNPYLGRIPEDEELTRLGYRYLVIEDYLAFYTVESNAVIVHRIINSARDYPDLL